MKTRCGFVSNSSSTAFIIINKTDEPLTIRDFVEEAGLSIAQEYVDDFGDPDNMDMSLDPWSPEWKKVCEKVYLRLIEDVKDIELPDDIPLPAVPECELEGGSYEFQGKTEYFSSYNTPNEGSDILYPGENARTFGDEDETCIGRVFDYAMRVGGRTRRFTWRFLEWRR